MSCPLRLQLALCPWVAGPVPSSQVLVLQVHWLGPERLPLVLFVRLLVPLLKEELRATGRSGISWRCHCRHFFCTSSCTWPQKSAISPGGENEKDPVPRVLLTLLGPLHSPCHSCLVVIPCPLLQARLTSSSLDVKVLRASSGHKSAAVSLLCWEEGAYGFTNSRMSTSTSPVIIGHIPMKPP